jgi:hypothetical protein
MESIKEPSGRPKFTHPRAVLIATDAMYVCRGTSFVSWARGKQSATFRDDLPLG